MERIISRFWWQKHKGKRGIHWCEWRKLCDTKEDDGLRFKSLSKFNLALLAKHGWRLFSSLDSLLVRVKLWPALQQKTNSKFSSTPAATLKVSRRCWLICIDVMAIMSAYLCEQAKYYSDSPFLRSSLGNYPSYTSKSIWAAKGLLQTDMSWRVGSSTNISIWKNAWVPGSVDYKIYSYVRNQIIDKVSELTEPRLRQWREDYITNIFSIEDSTRLSIKRVESKRWKPPKPPSLKISFDAALQSYTKKSCLGIVGRNSERTVLGLRMIINNHVPTPLATEALACLQVIQIGLDLGFRDVVIERDSLTIVKKLHAQNEDGSVISAYITNANSLSEIYYRCIFSC
ncbi:hypothetical protein Gogos_011845 [Gossypium gossypioides]|uniref:RNase H type-1 domain-containing protein n=1 Tax=Gossypium gossypioides TaxID=34282 RepID=A0A7J9BQN7_GOSGO|nr:hypothetical protein [Gossypium gossypioides]